ncbi:MAG: ferredoxin [Paracoccaceae bacterium]
MTAATLKNIGAAAAKYQLAVLGVALPGRNDPVPKGTQSVVLLGPKEPGFWPYFKQQPEYQNRLPNPVDRWSKRTVPMLAAKTGGTAIYPFGGPPYAPFISWAQQSAAIWASPVGLLVHATAGLFVSFRGAIALPYAVPDPQQPAQPCATCGPKPCLSACPANALTGTGYDLAACHSYLDTAPGRDCLDNGCAARRSCPVSQTYGRNPEQSAHHMKAFHP